MDPANVDTFVQNIFDFVINNNLDRVDIDWEYPGATDIPGIPEGLASDGTNYLNFIKKMKTNFPFNKTVSIAAPAS
ncbi:Glycoside hydrolase, family 18, catalytic domain [Penicillium camemberti]|uniref:Glycoside hydrolase, family 18, catalytic domain n=1 Tax=Penicillium camemberti (strain FM 013) TaxID=1429867 RepID=A0A0G4NV44_PENC3|nr:Glycoside hydrolase, family 18, catalytic domain [Penicillium camemberti]